jgi:murein DD-endopeptidase MepM/ murein hydrolase activator NlpD
MMPLRFALKIASLSVLALMLARAATTRAEPAPEAPVRDSYFSYPLRAGESLADVARVFRVPVEELIELNQIRDPNRLQLAQMIRVPDAYAREAAELRAERERLVADKQRAERESQDRQRAAAAVEAQLHQLEAEKNSVARELSMMAGWQRTAMIALGLFFGAVAWGVKNRLERANLVRKQQVLAAENGALMTAKEHYRQAAGQLELRYQTLYAKKAGTPALAIAEGVERIRQAFAEGAKDIEALLATLLAERETQLQLLEAEDKSRSGIFQPLRELLERSFKYHTP